MMRSKKKMGSKKKERSRGKEGSNGEVRPKLKKGGEDRIRRLAQRMTELYPDEKLDLKFSNPFELLVSAILAAQARDEVVNQATEGLFREFGTPKELSSATPEKLKKYISKINFWYKKAEVIIKVAREIDEKYGGHVPDDIDELVKIKGVGRKTANMVVGAGYGKPAIITDTHFIRVSARLGIAEEGDKPEKIEEKVKNAVPPEIQTPFSFAMIRHGKLICKAKNPLCDECALKDECIFYKKIKQKV